MARNTRIFGPLDVVTLRQMHADGKINREIAAEMNFSDSTISKQLARLGLAPNTIALRKLHRINERNEVLRAEPKAAVRKERPRAQVAPMDERYARTPRPAAIQGPDLLLERMMAGRR